MYAEEAYFSDNYMTYIAIKINKEIETRITIMTLLSLIPVFRDAKHYLS